MKNVLLSVLVIGAVLGTFAFFNVSPFRSVIEQAVGSAVGSTFNTAKIAAVDMSPATNAATSTSILNTDASARWVEGAIVACTGIQNAFTNTTGTGLASYLLQAATTSVANLGSQGNTNLAVNLTVATGTTGAAVFSYSATSTASAGTSAPNPVAFYWAPSTYLTFTFNATSTGACIVKTSYIPS